MSTVTSSPLLYELEDRPPAGRTVVAALGHLLAIVASIVTAPLLIAGALDLSAANKAYVINASLVVSGIATFIQVYRFGWIGSGLLAVQGTSFTFIGPMAFAASALALDDEQALMGVLLGTAAVGALLTMLAALMLQQLRRIITPSVTATTIFLLGVSLVLSAWSNLQFAVQAEGGAVVWPQALFTLAVIGICATRKNPWLRLTSICLGLLSGVAFTALTGGLSIDFSTSSMSWFALQPWRYPLTFDPLVLLLFLPIFLVSITESIGDITATAMLSKEPLSGSGYWRRLRGGIMGDGFNTILASLFGTFPNTTFSQNNGVIQITGVASRHVGMVLALLLIVMGSFPVLGSLVQSVPAGVLHATTGFLFTLIAWAGIRIVRTMDQPKRGYQVMLVSTVCAFVAAQIPDALTTAGIKLPEYAQILLGFPVAVGAVVAITIEILAIIFRSR